MADKGPLSAFIEHVKNINAFFALTGWIVAGVGAVAAAATLLLSYLNLITDKDHVIYVLVYILSAQLLVWIFLSIIFYSVRKRRMNEPISDAQFRAAAIKLLRVWLHMSQSSAECDSRIFEYLFLYRLADDEGE